MAYEYDYSYECKRLVEQMEPRPFKTFRTEFNITSSSTEHLVSNTSTTYTSTQSQYYQHLKNSKQENGNISHTTVTITKDDSPLTKRSKIDNDAVDSVTNGRPDKLYTTTTHINTNEPQKWGTSMKFTEIKSLKRIHKVNEGIGTDNIIETPGIIHPTTGELLTIEDAISHRILDVRSGRIVISPDGSTMSIEEAAQNRRIDPKLAERLAGPCGITEDGRDVSLLEAIQRELYDAEHGFSDPSEKRIKVTTSSGTSIADAIDTGKVDTKTATFSLENGEKISVSEAYQKGYLTYTEVKIKTNAVCLYDALSQGLVDDKTGWIVDRNSGNKFQIDAAIKQGLVDGNVREIVDPKTDNKITLNQALAKGVIHQKLGKYIYVHEKLPFAEAKRRQLIVKPMTLKDVCDRNLYEDGKIMSPLHSSKLSILESVSRGVLDCDTIKSITNTQNNELLTLSESLASGIIIPSGDFKDALTGEVCPIPIAVERGLISSVALKSIFDIDGFKNPNSEDFLSFNAASSMGLISKNSGGSLVTDIKSGKLVPFVEGVKTGVVRPQVFDMLNNKIGIFHNNKELTVLEAVFLGYIDPKTGNLIDPRSKKVVPVNDAVKTNFITSDGAALLNSILSINIISQTISKIVKRYSTVTTTGVNRKEIKMTFGEAVRRGLIDEMSQTYRDPDTNKLIPIQEALSEGIIGVYDEPESPSKTVASPTQKHSPIKTIKTFRIEAMDVDEPQQMHSETVIIPGKKPDHVQLISKLDTSEQSTSKITKSEHITTKSVTSDFLTSERQTTMEKQVFELPPDGWFLSEAIDQHLFDPVTGLFIIPGTDRLVSFEECVKLQIINPTSALVLDPTNSRMISLLRSLEKHVLNSTGNYNENGKMITMKEAIEKKFIVLQNRMEFDQNNQRLIQITKMSGKPDLVEVSNILDKNPPTFTAVLSTESETTSLAPVQVSPGIIYDPATALLVYTDSGKCENLLVAVNEKKIDPKKVFVKDPYTGNQIDINEAIRKGIVDKDSGDYKDKSGRKIPLNDAAKFGVISIIEMPSTSTTVVTLTKHNVVVDPKTGENVSLEEARDRGIINKKTYEKLKSQDLISQEMHMPSTDQVSYQNIPVQEKVKTMGTISISLDDDEGRPTPGEITRGRVTTEPKYKVVIGRAVQNSEIEPKHIILQKMRKKIVKPKDAVKKGLIDEATADILDKRETFVTPEGETLNLSEAISRKKLDGNKGAILDPQHGDVLTINQAMDRGILDPDGTNQLLIPLNRSLSIPQLVDQGLIEPENSKIIHPETGNSLTLHEAIMCNIVDPLCQMVNSKGKKVTLEQAIAKGEVDDDSGTVKTKDGNLNLITAIEYNVFDQPITKSTVSDTIPLAGMTLPVALNRGLIDCEKKRNNTPNHWC